MAHGQRDPYDILGVASDASDADLARAYRRAARATHPDSCPAAPDAAGRFREVNDAYEQLREQRRRLGGSAPEAPALSRPGSHIVLGRPATDSSAVLARLALFLLHRG